MDEADLEFIRHKRPQGRRPMSALTRPVFAFLILLVAGLSPAAARPLTEAETTALADKVAAFDAAMRASDYETIIAVIPPRVLKHIADGAGAPVDELKVALVGQMKEIFASVTMLNFGMDVAAAEHLELSDGSPYVLIPTTTVMEAEGLGKMKVESRTLGMLDEGAWYLVRIGDAGMVGVLRQVYPQFAGVEFPAETITALEE
jgi:hypothetical protein